MSNLKSKIEYFLPQSAEGVIEEKKSAAKPNFQLKGEK
jgi:hypothetical protein